MADEVQDDARSAGASSDALDTALTTTTVLFSIGWAAVSIAAPPVALGLGVGAGVLQLASLIRQRITRKAAQVATGAEERLGPDAVGAAGRITADDDLAALSYQAVDASLQSHHDEQAVALGRVLGDALRSREPLSVDEASIYLEALRSLDLMHLIALRQLGEVTESQPSGNWMHNISATLDVHDEAVIVGIAAGLQRAGAIQLDPPRVWRLLPNCPWAALARVRQCRHLTASPTAQSPQSRSPSTDPALSSPTVPYKLQRGRRGATYRRG